MKPSTSHLLLMLSLTTPYAAMGQTNKQTEPVVRVDGCQIRLADERDLAAGQSGILSAVHVREGDRIREGMVIAELDVRVPEATLAVARKQAENNVSVRFAIAAAKVAEAEYKAALRANEIERKAIPESEIRKLRLEMERSILEIEVAKHELAVNGLRSDEAQTLVNSYRIEAPMNGVVSRLFKLPGESMQVGEALLQCQRTDVVYISADVHINLLSWLRKGRQVEVLPAIPHPRFRDTERQMHGTVFYVATSVDPVSREAHILVEVDNKDGFLVTGTTATLAWNPIEKPVASPIAPRD
jgi:multidrug resistance efflux pump